MKRKIIVLMDQEVMEFRPTVQIEDDASIVSSGDDHPINTTSSGNNDVTLNHKSTSFVFFFKEIHDGIQNNSNATQGDCGFKMEKPTMPRFTRNVGVYAIFRADFKHVIESRAIGMRKCYFAHVWETSH